MHDQNMGGLKTLVALFVLNAATAFGAHAEDSLVDLFATCAGRFSAQMEHQWLMQETSARQSERMRGEILDLLAAVASSDALAVHAMHRRLASKAAHASLLHRATFDLDRESAKWASARAQTEIEHCASLVLLAPGSVPGNVNHVDALENTSMPRHLPVYESNLHGEQTLD